MTLREGFLSHGIAAGVATSTSNATKYTDLITTHWSAFTGENTAMMARTQPDRGTWQLANLDREYAVCQENELEFKLHSLAWYLENPAWLDGAHASSMQAIFENRCYMLSRRYPQATADINEVWTQTGALIPSAWDKTPHYPNSLFDIATNVVAPWWRLEYNDHKWAEPIDAQNVLRARELAKQGLISHYGLQFHQVQDEVIAEQNHLSLPESFRLMSRNFIHKCAMFADVGCRINITEWDVRAAMPGATPGRRYVWGDLPADIRGQVSAQYGRWTDAILFAQQRYRNIDTVTWWGLNSAKSWIPSFYPGMVGCLPLDERNNESGCYRAIMNVL